MTIQGLEIPVSGLRILNTVPAYMLVLTAWEWVDWGGGMVPLIAYAGSRVHAGLGSGRQLSG